MYTHTHTYSKYTLDSIIPADITKYPHDNLLEIGHFAVHKSLLWQLLISAPPKSSISDIHIMKCNLTYQNYETDETAKVKRVLLFTLNTKISL